jgi:hypothetical protein
MQILTNQQVTYCNLIRKNQEKTEYLPGVSYQNKLFIKRKFFDLKQKYNATEYCKQKFLASKGIISYILVGDATGLTVWKEDKSVSILGNEPELDLVKTINLEELVSKMRSVGGIKIKDRRYNLKVYPQCFIGSEAVKYMVETLKISSEQAIRLGQRLIDEKWIHHVVDKHKFEDDFLFYRFYWDEQ